MSSTFRENPDSGNDDDMSDNASASNEDSKTPANSHNHIAFKKNKDQTEILDIEFDKNPYWNKDKMRELGDRLGLKPSQIYKWHWDRSQTVHKRFQKNLRKISKANKKEGLVPIIN